MEFLPRLKSKPAEEEACLQFWRKTIEPQTCLQGMQLPLSNSNLGTLENPAANHTTREQKLPSIQQAGSVCSPAALQGGFC